MGSDHTGAPYPVPDNEADRLAEVHALSAGIDSAEGMLGALARVAARLCNAPFAFVSLIDAETQRIEACEGVALVDGPRAQSLCTYTVMDPPRVLVIEDARKDPRFKDLDFVVGEPHIRFYAGAPLVTATGHAVGALCVFDDDPRALSDEARDGLEVLAQQVVQQLERGRTLAALREANNELRASERRFHEVTSAIQEGVWLMDVQSQRFPFVSPGVTAIWGLAPEAIESGAASFLELVHEDDLATLAEPLAHADGEPFDEVVRIHHPNKGLRHVRIQAFPIHEDGALTRVAGVSQDVTELVEARSAGEKRAARQARLAELQQVLFAASHTLRTPIRQGKSFAQLLRRQAGEALDPATRDNLGYIEDGFARLEVLVEGLQLYAELTARDEPPVAVDLGAVAGRRLAALDERIEASGGTLKLGPLPTVDGDPVQLSFLLGELVENAVSTHQGAPAIEVSSERVTGGHRITVRDDGPGFDPALVDKACALFQRLDAAAPGAGVGLSICRQVVAAHGGELHIETAPGRGCVVSFTLPAATKL